MSRKENLLVRMVIAGALVLGAALGVAVADGTQAPNVPAITHTASVAPATAATPN